MICELLGANWYAVVATAGLGALAVCHIVYAFILTVAKTVVHVVTIVMLLTEKPATVEWASQNMLVLGIIVLLGLGLHFFNFWYNMMFAELTHIDVPFHPADVFLTLSTLSLSLCM